MFIFSRKKKKTSKVKSAKAGKTGGISSVQKSDIASNHRPQSEIKNQTMPQSLKTGSEKMEAGAPSSASQPLAKDLGQIPLYAQSGTRMQPTGGISTPGDANELEADRMADHVMQMPEPKSRNTPGSPGGYPGVHTGRSRQGQKAIQTKQTGTSTPEHTATSPIIKAVQQSSGQPLAPAARAYFEPRFGFKLDQVRIQTGDSAERAAAYLKSQAFTMGNTIVFGKGRYAPDSNDGKKLLAHELAHVVSPSHMALMRRVTSDYDEIEDCLTYGLFDWAITDSNAHDVLVILSGLNATDLNDTLARMESDGFLTRLLDNISTADLPVYNTMIQRVLQRIQRTGARRFAAGLGLSSQTAMAQTQSAFMHAQNTAAAAALHGPSPTAAQVSAQQTTSVASTSIAPQTATLSVADENTQNAAATAARSTFVTWVQANHPDLNISKSDIRIDCRAIFNRGLSIIAFADAGQAVVGPAFTRLVNANPAYALPTIIHELRGHEQYGPYAQPGTEYGLELYDQAAALMPGYTQPTGAGRTSEIDAYAYQETEIYSLMLEVPYYTPVTSAHSALASINYDPEPEISNRIGIIKTQFEPRVARSLLRGLVLRFRNDPRLSSQSVSAFERGIRGNYSASQASGILQ